MDVKIEAVLKLHIPPLGDHCMSSCKYKIVSLHHVTESSLVLLPRHLISSSFPSLWLQPPLAFLLGVYISCLWLACLVVYSSSLTFCSSWKINPDVKECYHLWSSQFYFATSELYVPIWYAYSMSLVQILLVLEYSQLEVRVDCKVVLQKLMSFLHLFSLKTQYNHRFPAAHDQSMEFFDLELAWVK